MRALSLVSPHLRLLPARLLFPLLRSLFPLASWHSGVRPFEGFTKDSALKALRQFLNVLNVPDADSYGTQDCRRGHNEDMVSKGKCLTEILIAGGWRSASGPAPYTNAVELEMRACLEAHYTAMTDED